MLTLILFQACMNFFLMKNTKRRLFLKGLYCFGPCWLSLYGQKSKTFLKMFFVLHGRKKVMTVNKLCQNIPFWLNFPFNKVLDHFSLILAVWHIWNVDFLWTCHSDALHKEAVQQLKTIIDLTESLQCVLVALLHISHVKGCFLKPQHRGFHSKGQTGC